MICEGVVEERWSAHGMSGKKMGAKKFLGKGDVERGALSPGYPESVRGEKPQCQ